jgi:NTP pyrophosphatase (non-canonical NTP hydrolase)
MQQLGNNMDTPIVVTLDDYHKAAVATAVYPEFKLDKGDHLHQAGQILYPVLGLVGEAGEVAEKVKKIIRDKGSEISNEDRAEIIKELGDVLWYITSIASKLNVGLDTVAQTNIDKLYSRMGRGKLQGSGDNR